MYCIECAFKVFEKLNTIYRPHFLSLFLFVCVYVTFEISWSYYDVNVLKRECDLSADTSIHTVPLTYSISFVLDKLDKYILL